MNFDDLKYDQLSPDDLVKLAYLVLLRRPADKVGLASWAERASRGEFRPDELVEALLRSPEYLMLNRIPFGTMLHRARQQWVRELGPFEEVLDIGGSSANTEMGALIELGYTHRPKSITIFDLPPDQQYWGKPKFSQDRPYEFSWGRVEYLHGRAEKIEEAAALQDRTFDMVFMGQAIEHIYPEKLPHTMAWIRAHLKPGGRFICDTPNRAVTAVQSPQAFIDADHKIEFTPAQLEDILAKAGFRTVRRWGVLHMPSTASTGIFNPLEVYESHALSEAADECYVFALECTPA